MIKSDDLVCACCGAEGVDKNFLNRLEVLNQLVSFDLSEHGVFRCKKHNTEIGGAENSPHMYGLGADIKSTSARHKRKLVEAAIFLGFKGIGIYDKHVHVDDMDRWHHGNVIWPGVSK